MSLDDSGRKPMEIAHCDRFTHLARREIVAQAVVHVIACTISERRHQDALWRLDSLLIEQALYAQRQGLGLAAASRCDDEERKPSMVSHLRLFWRYIQHFRNSQYR